MFDQFLLKLQGHYVTGLALFQASILQ